MSKPKRSSITCSCGFTFDADVYRSINVSAEPHLKSQILAGQFNVVRCPACGREMAADVPFLYHDSDAGLMVWVYPSSSAGQADQIQDKIRRSREILGTVLPPSTIDANREVVFGIEELLSWLDRLQ
jgi:hypothetical protein